MRSFGRFLCRSHNLACCRLKAKVKGRQIDFIENFQYNFNVRNKKMLNMQDIGYFVYMQEQEEKEQEERALKVNVKNNTDFVGEQAPTKEERDRNKFFS